MPDKVVLASIVCGAVILGLLGASVRAQTPSSCKEPQEGTTAAPLFSPPLANVVTGGGRLQFYSAPNLHCPISGVFVIPKDELVAYAQTNDGWSSVMYANPRTGNDVSAWVRSARLKETGTAGPRQQVVRTHHTHHSPAKRAPDHYVLHEPLL
ncbi:hypothetical protein [Bradyrhizobium genosp. P]|uniref:hypothetical protein n=1 Tax=Bradyrhizobium genosp. P TaxID=83641 RepID=UPI003CEF81BB